MPDSQTNLEKAEEALFDQAANIDAKSFVENAMLITLIKSLGPAQRNIIQLMLQKLPEVARKTGSVSPEKVASIANNYIKQISHE